MIQTVKTLREICVLRCTVARRTKIFQLWQYTVNSSSRVLKSTVNTYPVFQYRLLLYRMRTRRLDGVRHLSSETTTGRWLFVRFYQTVGLIATSNTIVLVEKSATSKVAACRGLS